MIWSEGAKLPSAHRNVHTGTYTVPHKSSTYSVIPIPDLVLLLTIGKMSKL